MRYRLRSHDSKPIKDLAESPDVVRLKVRELANMIRTSKYAVVYTGAGLSTAAGIPDFRGPTGVWTMQAQGKQILEPDFGKVDPTFSHIVLKRLLDAGQVRHIISQNIDGLHLRSGVFPENLSELHGNYCSETCPKCKTSYFRPYAVWSGLSSTAEPGANVLDEESTSPRQRKIRRVDGGSPSKQARLSSMGSTSAAGNQKSNHQTGRKCEKKGCKGSLEDSVIHFGEDLPQQAITSATRHSQKADLGLVLGSSLRVTPACDLPRKILGNGGRLVIVNLQSTPLDGLASLVIHATCDQVMQMLVEELSPPSRTAIEESDKSGLSDLSSKEKRMTPEIIFRSLNWQIPQTQGACVLTKGRDDQDFEKGERILGFELPLLVQVGQVTGGL